MKLTQTVDVDREPACVFSWLDDAARAATWMASVSAVEILRRTPGLVGTTFRETVADDSGSTELRGVVTTCRVNREIAFHLEGQFNTVDVDYRLDDLAGGTRLTVRADVHFKGVVKVLSLVTGPLFKRKVLGQLRGELAELKRVCES